MRRASVLLFLILWFPAPALALDLEPYVKLFPVGLTYFPNAELTAVNNGQSAGKVTFGAGFGFYGAVGLLFQQHYGVEFEGGYARSQASSLDGNPGGAVIADNDAGEIINGMINVYYRDGGWEHSSGIFSWHYFAGAGFGQAQQKLFLSNLVIGQDTSGAYQGFLGLELAPVQSSNWLTGSLLIQYKYLTVEEGQMGPVETGYDMHSLNIGIRLY